MPMRSEKIRFLLPCAVLCLVLAGGPVAGEPAAAQDDSESADVLDQIVETIEDLLEAAVDWIDGDDDESGETADLGFEIEPNG